VPVRGAVIGPLSALCALECFTAAQDITYNIASVTEASTWAMMGLGLAGMLAFRARRHRS